MTEAPHLTGSLLPRDTTLLPDHAAFGESMQGHKGMGRHPDSPKSSPTNGNTVHPATDGMEGFPVPGGATMPPTGLTVLAQPVLWPERERGQHSLRPQRAHASAGVRVNILNWDDARKESGRCSAKYTCGAQYIEGSQYRSGEVMFKLRSVCAGARTCARQV